ncbi:hypothetical protein GCM10009677_35280 [Sphaerisporangium rubeum]|uniref:Integral membrane protein n=1 Tax=Sphaerisporangium rubeum TaxID=321317 RepID=A0A7X0IJT0_9ACTN|nr:DUF6113 family protein [Sphaerisporangium rubeum]MBB6476243.1 hypothetical protein [Sphaerisporangium rubeum]
MEEEQAGRGHPVVSALVGGLAYAVLFVLGVVFGAVAGLEHSWDRGGSVPLVPLVPIGLCVVLFGLLYGAGRLMSSKLGAFVPGMGWMLVALLFSVQRPEGDLVIAANPAGYWYLAAGALALVAAVLLIPSSGSWLLHQGSYPSKHPVNFPDGRSA